MSLCTVISANAVNLSSTVLLWRYVFSLFGVEKLLSTEALVTESTIQVKFKDFLEGARPTCAIPLPAPLLQGKVNSACYISQVVNPVLLPFI